jgi:small subunit ribosomal protein S7
MPRKGPVKLKKQQADPVYGHVLLAKLINRSMKDGKKSNAGRQVYKAMELIQKETGEDPIKVFEEAIGNIKPTMEVRPRRVGGAAYQVPMPVRGPRRDSLAIRWLITASRALSNKEYHTYAEKLTKEIIDCARGEGGAVKKRQEVEKVAEANRAFAHFRW